MTPYVATLMALIRYGAQGETAAVAVNNQGGVFHLTDEKVDGGYRAFCVVLATLQVIEGAWHWDDGGVIVDWMNGSNVHYGWDGWKINYAILDRIGREQKKLGGES